MTYNKENNNSEGQKPLLRFQPYSFSKLDTHEQCPRRFKYKYVLKMSEGDVDRTPLIKGNAIHQVLERYPNIENMDIDKEYIDIAIDYINSDVGQQYFSEDTLSTAEREYRIRLNIGSKGLYIPEDGTKRKDLHFLGFIDYIGDDVIPVLVDFKTGKYRDLKYQDFSQLTYYAIQLFTKHPDIDKIRIAYSYVEHFKENDLILERRYLTNYIRDFVTTINKAENSNYDKNVSILCNYCPFKDICDKDAS